MYPPQIYVKANIESALKRFQGLRMYFVCYHAGVWSVCPPTLKFVKLDLFP